MSILKFFFDLEFENNEDKDKTIKYAVSSIPDPVSSVEYTEEGKNARVYLATKDINRVSRFLRKISFPYKKININIVFDGKYDNSFLMKEYRKYFMPNLD